MKKFRTVAIVALIVFSIPVFLCAMTTTKPSIYSATAKELDSSSDLIGEKKSQDIYNYCQSNNVQSVSQLDGKIPYVGDKTIKDLKKKYK